MQFTIALGWWLIPVAITIAAIVWARWADDDRPAHDYGAIGRGLGNALIYLLALVVILFGWLVFFAASAFAQTVAPAGPTPVIVPWGEWTIAIVNSFVMPILLPLVGMLAAWIFGQVVRLVPWLQRYVTAQLVERLLTNVLDFGVNAVTDAAKGKTLSVTTGRAVLDVAMRRAIETASPALIKAAGGPEELAAKAFRKMDLEPEATVKNVLDPVVRGIAVTKVTRKAG